MTLEYSYDAGLDHLRVEGVTYSGQFFRLVADGYDDRLARDWMGVIDAPPGAAEEEYELTFGSLEGQLEDAQDRLQGFKDTWERVVAILTPPLAPDAAAAALLWLTDSEKAIEQAKAQTA